MGEYFNTFGEEEAFLFIDIKIRNLKVKDWYTWLNKILTSTCGRNHQNRAKCERQTGKNNDSTYTRVNLIAGHLENGKQSKRNLEEQAIHRKKKLQMVI